MHGDRVRDRLLYLAQEARGVDNVIALIAKTLEECDVAGGIEGVGCALAITAAEIKKHLIGQVVAVHWHEYSEISQAGQQGIRHR